jgi:glycosyltransferase involved in cell wall biosynthesis
MKRIAIVSSFNEACGNASYTNVLAQEIGRYASVEIIPLNLFLLQSNIDSVIKAADDYIDEICSKLKDFDGVNFQFEAGLYGPTTFIACNRVIKMINSCKSVIVTMHRIDYSHLNVSTFIKALGRSIVSRSIRIFVNSMRDSLRSGQYAKFIKSIDKINNVKNAAIMVHTKRDADLLKHVFKVNNFKDYPITFLNKDKREKYLSADRDKFREKYLITEGQKVVGIFGFISEYKGHETFLRALQIMPENYVGLIFGTQHPQSVGVNVKIDTYLNNLVKIFEKDKKSKQKISIINAKHKKEYIHSNHVTTLQDRVRFCGNLDDDDFIQAMICCDAVVLPYLETGQSMSGVASLALETKSNCFLSNNPSFNGLKKYYGNSFYSFDIGNYIDLSQKIIYTNHGSFNDKLEAAYEKYNIEKNAKLHYDMLKLE